MKTKILIAVIGILVTIGVLVLSLKTKIDWTKMQAVEVYKDSAVWKDFEKMKDVDLDSKEHYTLNLEQAKKIFSKSKTEVQIVTVWREYKYAVVYFNEGKPLRLKVSNYGGFFLVLNFGRKYEVKKADLEEWETLWRNAKVACPQHYHWPVIVRNAGFGIAVAGLKTEFTE